ncbi:aminotransferase class I/II-fold pyridoxal phosphate-dependent enzyme [Mucilaginibacter sp.]|uniref:threonine aldolase family protein n=1 Tax=Mucilaginibacter sp. TaxID=1882438 RepID=UPI00260399A4|nr:aminotransferase class I/II-fold pyridoxal phosphate-dependent enzyme [Mucilaginibacter sp.]MDB4922673.1 aminotransferase class I/II-fold pyridoxal phosphate-dependent enzyme [Mucilaginibacter sp.]
MREIKRRNFLKLSGLSLVPALLPGLAANAHAAVIKIDAPVNTYISFTDDGVHYAPADYLAKLQEISQKDPIKADVYGQGGTLAKLTKRFAEITGKEAATYMPTGTMANQLAISVLNGENTKIFVQDTSHIYRDEADAAQSVFNKRLMPLAPGAAFFTLEDLKAGINYVNDGEVFKSGIGTVAIENPVRRCDGQQVPIEEIRKISAFCRSNGYKLHLDGARIYLAAAVSGISIAEYASNFDTIYISLYKYLGADGGAILCGDKAVIDKMEHLIKIHGGTVYSSWSKAAMALYHLDGLEDRLKQTFIQANDLFSKLNKLPGININPIKGGSNIFDLKLTATDVKKFRQQLYEKHKVLVRNANHEGVIKLQVNETLLKTDNQSLVAAFTDALSSAKV